MAYLDGMRHADQVEYLRLRMFCVWVGVCVCFCVCGCGSVRAFIADKYPELWFHFQECEIADIQTPSGQVENFFQVRQMK